MGRMENTNLKGVLARLILLAFVGLALLSCATVGNKTLDDPKKFLNIREGISTKEQVYAIFGQPHDVDYSQDGAQSLWEYYKIEASPNAWSYVPYLGILAGGTNTETTKVYFFFNAQGKLIRTQTGKASDSINSWVGIAKEASHDRQERRRAIVARVATEMQRMGHPFDSKHAKIVATWITE